MLGMIRCGSDDVKGRVDGPGAGEKGRMRFAGTDDALELGVRQEAVGVHSGRQMRSVAGFGGATDAMAAD